MVQVVAYVLALALSFASVRAAPIPEPMNASPALSSHDPYSIHRRSIPHMIKRDDIDIESDSETPIDLTEEEGTCSTECGLIKVSGVKNEREALCSSVGLEATQCIDTAFPHTRFQKSAMSEYEKIVASCGT